MGFLSGLAGGKKTNVPASGFFAMPPQYQEAFNTVLGNVNSGVGGINANMFRPMDQTVDETRALEMFREGFAPTEQSLKSDISMLMNPFEQFVMDDVNRAAASDYSILKQDMNAAGQFGSNRQRLGANDIENTRLSTLGNLRRGAYDSALNTLLTRIIPQRQADATGLLGVGDFQRELDSRQKTAPLQALSAQTGLIGSIPTEFGNFGSPAQTIKTGGGLGGMLRSISNIASLGSSFLPSSFNAGAFLNGLPWCDERLKEDIVHEGMENGFNVYSFNYIGQPQRYRGVIAQEVMKTHPEAVVMDEGYYRVDCDKIGVKFEEVACH